MNRKRFFKWSGSFLLIVAGSLVTTWWAVFHTEAGARWAWSKIEQAAGGWVTASSPQGTLAGGFEITELSIAAGGLQARLSEVSGAIGLRGFPVRLVVRDLLVNEADFMPDPAVPGQTETRSDLALPLEIQLRRGLIRQLRLRDATGGLVGEPLQLSVSGEASQILRISELAIRGEHMAAEVAGFAQLVAPFSHEGTLDLTLPEAWTDGVGLTSRHITIEAAGDVHASRIGVISEAGRLGLDATVMNWLESPQWDARLVARGLSMPTEWWEQGVRVEELELLTQGSLRDYSMQGRASLVAIDTAGLELELEGSGTGGELQIDRAKVSGQPFQLDLQGRVGWAVEPYARLSVSVGYLEPRVLTAQWPDEHPITGSFHVDWRPGLLAVEDLALAIADHPSRLTGNAAWRMATEEASASLQWQNLRWPLGSDSATLASHEGSLELSGGLDEWQVAGQLDFRTGTWPAGRFGLNGQGSRTQAGFQLTEGELLGGMVGGQLSLDWQDRLAWHALLEAKGLRLADLWPEWPAVIDTELRIASDAEGLVLDVRRLQGTLQEAPLSASGTIILREEGLAFEQFKLAAPGSNVEIDGSLAGEAGLEFAIEAKRPGLAADLLRGEISGNGALRWNRGLPAADLDLEVRELELDGLSIGRLSLNGDAGIRQPGASMNLEASRVARYGLMLDRVSGELLGTRQGHVLTASASNGQHSLSLSLAGQLTGWAQPADIRWAGQLRQLRFLLEQQEILALADSAPFNVSRQRLGLGRACFRVADSGEACIDSDWRPGEIFSLQASLGDVPLAVAGDLIGTNIRFSQRVDGNFEWSRQRGARPDGWAELSISPGTIEREDFKIEGVATGEGRLGFRLNNGQLSEGRLALPFRGVGGVDIEFAIADLAMDGTGRLTGRAQLDIEDLALFEVFVPGLNRLSGRLDVDATLGGRIADPYLDGQVALREAEFDFPLMGLNQVRMDLQGTVSRNNQWAVEGTIGSGEGNGRVHARFDISDWDDPWFGLHLEGERLMLIDVPSATALVSPNLNLGWRAGQWSLAGEVVVPEARLSPASSVAERVAESKDLELIAGQPALGAEPAGRRTAVPLTGALLLGLGDQVRVDMPNVLMSASGELQLEWDQALLPQVDGQILLDGEVRTFGPILRVDQGRVRYQGRPLDDPELSIRAERDVFGNTQIRAAGVRIGGSARQPTIEAYTYPMTTEERAWTLLVTGTDFEYGQGVGAFDIGTYVAPRLYVSYGVSLFDDERQVGVRYDLRKGFGVKATSSQTDNGIDMSYTIER
jgi:translocation and assembly module TamB